jgi:hypothetical protein
LNTSILSSWSISVILHDEEATVFLRRYNRTKLGKSHTDYASVESIRTDAGPRQHIVAYLGELSHDEQKRWQRTVSIVFVRPQRLPARRPVAYDGQRCRSKLTPVYPQTEKLQSTRDARDPDRGRRVCLLIKT